MARRLGRWQQLLVDALVEQDSVSVQAVVELHLGRRADRSERQAASRAAHLLARRGGVTVERIEGSAGMGRSRLAVSRSAGWPAWMKQDADASPPTPAVQWLPGSASDVTPVPRFGRWQQLIMDALTRYEVVGVQAVVEGHLRRRGDRSETTAAQRAAHLLARSGQVRIARVRVPAGRGRPARGLLTVARADADLAAITVEALQLAAVRRMTAADRTDDALDEIVGAVGQAGAQLDEVDLRTVDAQSADRVARSLARPLRQFSQLRQDLLAAGRRPDPW